MVYLRDCTASMVEATDALLADEVISKTNGTIQLYEISAGQLQTASTRIDSLVKRANAAEAKILDQFSEYPDIVMPYLAALKLMCLPLGRLQETFVAEIRSRELIKRFHFPKV